MLRGKISLPEKTNQMGGACPTLACSHLASLLQMVPLKPSLPTSSARWLASLHSIANLKSAALDSSHLNTIPTWDGPKNCLISLGELQCKTNEHDT